MSRSPSLDDDLSFLPLAPATVRELRELDVELLRDLVALLLELTPERLRVLDEALQRDDLPTARWAAHAICSTAGIVGATALLAAARLAEAAPTAPLARIAAAALAGEWHELAPPLRRWLGGGEDGTA
jgi:HPt (histidine-containing phosphotransfer) domain-containing protein